MSTGEIEMTEVDEATGRAVAALARLPRGGGAALPSRIESRRRVVWAARWMLDEWEMTSHLSVAELGPQAREALGCSELTDDEVRRAVKVAAGA